VAELRIRVGASLDASIETVFPKIATYAARGRKSVEREMNAAGASIPRAMKTGTDKAEAEFAKLAASVKSGGASMMTPGVKAIAAFGGEAKTRFAVVKRDFDAMARSAEADMRRVDNAARGGSKGPSFWKQNVSPRVLGMGLAGKAMGLAGDVARGAGVNLDAGSMVQSYVQRQALAQDIANSGYQPGAKGAAGQLQSAASIQSEAMNVAKSTATDPTKALEGLQKFVATTGDLETGRAILGDMAKLSNATGSSMEDVVTAAGDVSAKLGEMPHKAESINAIMRQIAGQGKLGAVEMRDFAKQLASVAAVAPQFGGSIEKNIGEMAILLQEGRQLGGAKNAAQAATGVRAFASTFTKGARVKEFAARGIQLRNEDGSLRGAQQIIMDSLKATHGDANQLYGKLFTSEQSKVAVRGFETIYNHTEGDQATKLRAVASEFDRLRKATMSQADVEEANARKMETTQAMSQELNNSLQAVADEASAKLLPTMKELAPGLIVAAGGMAEAMVLVLGPLADFGKALSLLAGSVPVTHSTQGFEDVTREAQNLTHFNAHNGTTEISKDKFKSFQTMRDALEEQTDRDKGELDKLGIAPDEWKNVESNAKTGSGAIQKDAQAALNLRAQYESDKAKSDAMSQAMRDVMREIFSGTIKVEVTNPPAGTPGAPVVADQSGRHPAALPKK
jgi:hypothetical protein